jgi:DNA-binding PadR family transcriptional regulator
MKANRTRYAVLGALRHGPMSGYDVRRALEATVGHFWHESFGQIYPILRGLVADGLATVDSRRDPGRRERRVYVLTAAGEAELDRWLTEPIVQHQRPRDELLLKLFFGAGMPPGSMLGLVDVRRRETVRLLETYARIEATLLDDSVASDRAQPFWLATLRYGQLQAQAALRWCDETRGMILRRDESPDVGEDAPPSAAEGAR